MSNSRLFVKDICERVRPGGTVFITTINRTTESYIKSIIGAEYIARVVTIGTH